jgi:hypothetical protein
MVTELRDRVEHVIDEPAEVAWAESPPQTMSITKISYLPACCAIATYGAGLLGDSGAFSWDAVSSLVFAEPGISHIFQARVRPLLTPGQSPVAAHAGWQDGHQKVTRSCCPSERMGVPQRRHGRPRRP